MAEKTIAEYEAEGFTHVHCECDGCGYIVEMPFLLMRKKRPALNGMTLAEIKPLLACSRCKPKRQPDRIRAWRQGEPRDSLTGNQYYQSKR